jgi:hypothetical protein
MERGLEILLSGWLTTNKLGNDAGFVPLEGEHYERDFKT